MKKRYWWASFAAKRPGEEDWQYYDLVLEQHPFVEKTTSENDTPDVLIVLTAWREITADEYILYPD